jgi:hypothetical protein
MRAATNSAGQYQVIYIQYVPSVSGIDGLEIPIDVTSSIHFTVSIRSESESRLPQWVG